MSLQRSIACALIALEAAAMIYMGNVWVFPAAAVLLALVGAWGRRQWRLTLRGRLLLTLLVVVGFTAKWFIAAHAAIGGPVMVSRDVGYAFAQGALAGQVALLFVWSAAGVSSVFPLLGAVALSFLGAGTLPAEDHVCYGALGLGYALLTALFYAVSWASLPGTSTRRPWGWWFGVGVASLGALALAAGVASTSYRYRTELDDALVSVIQPRMPVPSVGFSDRARLGSVAEMKGAGPQEVGLRVYAGRAPGYLRGKAYTDFDGRNWSARTEQTALKPLREVPPSIPMDTFQGGLFKLSPADGALLEALETHPARDFRGVLFTPLDAAYASAPLPELRVNADGIPEGGLAMGRTPYTVYRPATGGVEEPRRDAYLGLPEGLDPRITALADEVFSGCASTAEKCGAVRQCFTQNYTYEFGITVRTAKIR